MSPRTRQNVQRLCAHLSERLESNEPPARLHGDLWAGNSFFIESGVALFDPAAYGGHREVDLALMQLFGGFSKRVFESYQATYPLAPGLEERLKIYQLYPLLVHLYLFGQSYARTLEELVSELS